MDLDTASVQNVALDLYANSPTLTALRSDVEQSPALSASTDSASSFADTDESGSPSAESMTSASSGGSTLRKDVPAMWQLRD